MTDKSRDLLAELNLLRESAEMAVGAYGRRSVSTSELLARNDQPYEIGQLMAALTRGMNRTSSEVNHG